MAPRACQTVTVAAIVLILAVMAGLRSPSCKSQDQIPPEPVSDDDSSDDDDSAPYSQLPPVPKE